MENDTYNNIENAYSPTLERVAGVVRPEDTNIENGNIDPVNLISSDETGSGSGSGQAPPASIGGESLNNLWIKNFIKSLNYQPKKRGFLIDGLRGYIEAVDVYVSGSFGIGGLILTVPLNGDIQSAIDEVSVAGGGEVRLVVGTYYPLTNITIPNGVSLIGAGKDITFIDFNSSVYGIVGESVSNIKLKDFTAQNSYASSGGVILNNCSSVYIENITSDSANEDGIFLTGVTGMVCLNSSFNNCAQYGVNVDTSNTNLTFINCRADSNGIGGFFQGSAGTNLTFINCNADQNAEAGFKFLNYINTSDNSTCLLCVANNNGTGFETTEASARFLGCFATGNGFDFNLQGGLVLGCTFNDLSKVSIGVGVISEGNINSSVITESKVRYMKNTSGATLLDGTVVVHKSIAGGDEITTTTAAGDNKVFGVVSNNNSIINNTFGNITTEGRVSLKVDGTTDIATGDWLSTFTVAGIAAKASAGHMAFAIALEDYTVDGPNGEINALVVSPRLI